MAELHSDRVTAVCIDGREYRADGRGVFDVPDAAAPRLMADFGLRPHAPQVGSGGAGADADYALMSTPDLIKEARRVGVPPDGLTRRKLIAALTAAGAETQAPGEATSAAAAAPKDASAAPQAPKDL